MLISFSLLLSRSQRSQTQCSNDGMTIVSIISYIYRFERERERKEKFNPSFFQLDNDLGQTPCDVLGQFFAACSDGGTPSLPSLLPPSLTSFRTFLRRWVRLCLVRSPFPTPSLQPELHAQLSLFLSLFQATPQASIYSPHANYAATTPCSAGQPTTPKTIAR